MTTHRHNALTGSDGDRWVGTWATTPDPLEKLALHGQTVRNIAYISLGGARVRVAISNAHGTGDLRVGRAHVGLRESDARLIAGSGRVVTFAGSVAAVIPAGANILSDPVPLDVPDLAELAISAFLPDDLPNDFRLTGHDGGHQTNFISPPGDFTDADDMPVQQAVESFLFASRVDVAATSETAGIVAFGDSITEGNLSRLDGNDRWPDQLARRLVHRADGRRVAIVNQGIGGNRLLHDGRGDNGSRRFDRDVLASPGVTHVIVALGINDFRNSARRSDQVVTAEQMTAGLSQLAVRARAHGLKVFGATITPWKNETFSGLYTDEGEAKRQAVNDWIRDSGTYDAVIDFDAQLRDPHHPDRFLPEYDCGDHLHPSDAGYRRMGDNIDLALFA